MFRKGVSALIANNQDEFLMVNLQAFKDHFFAVPGGGVEEGESLEQAVYREIEEELGIPQHLLECVGTCDSPLLFRFKTKKLHRDGIEYEGSERYFFGFRFTGDESDIVPQEAEIRSYKWVAVKDLKNYLLFDNQLEETSEKLLELFPFIVKE